MVKLRDGDAAGHKLPLADAVRKQIARRRWAEAWEHQRKGPWMRCLTGLVRDHGKDSMWGSLIDAAIAISPPPAPAEQIMTVKPPYREHTRLSVEQ